MPFLHWNHWPQEHHTECSVVGSLNLRWSQVPVNIDCVWLYCISFEHNYQLLYLKLPRIDWLCSFSVRQMAENRKQCESISVKLLVYSKFTTQDNFRQTAVNATLHSTTDLRRNCESVAAAYEVGGFLSEVDGDCTLIFQSSNQAGPFSWALQRWDSLLQPQTQALMHLRPIYHTVI